MNAVVIVVAGGVVQGVYGPPGQLFRVVDFDTERPAEFASARPCEPNSTIPEDVLDVLTESDNGRWAGKEGEYEIRYHPPCARE